MGHNRLPHLPHTYRWKEVIRLLEEDADLATLADAGMRAVVSGLKRVPDDKGFAAVLSTIVDLAAASRDKDRSTALWKLGVNIGEKASSFEFMSSIADLLRDRLGRVYPRSDVGKIAHDALVQALSPQVKGESASLFGDQADLTSLTRPFRGERFASLMHEFYSGFTSRYLSYYLSRELPLHVGSGKRFAKLDDQARFAKNLEGYCRESVRIADEFTSGWVGKAIYDGNTGPEAVQRYAHVAFKKLAKEFEKGGS